MIGPVLFLLMFGIFQIGVVYMQYQQVGFAASEGARCAAVARNAPAQTPACAPGVASITAAAQQRAIAKSPSLDLQASNVTVSGGSFPGTVTVTVRYATELPIIQKDINLRASSTAKMER